MKYTHIGLVVLLAVSSFSWSQSPAVKLSKSGICHDSRSSWYSRTQSFTPYPSLEACLAAGGRLPKGFDAAIEQPPGPGTEYKREYFGSGWADEDGDCRDSRQEALAAQSTGPVRFDSRGCRVIAGRWISPFTGKAIHDPSAIDIDHVVPLKWAWDHGASAWSREERERFANDPVNLLSVEASLNRSKGAKGILEWLPPSGQCQYLLRFLRIVASYKLNLAEWEAEQHRRTRAGVCGT
ncbi:HNH endonuclease family protein [Gilvimarinus sp. F26214L]|uniref:HNH endonuclease family protein n=1 Tax=Gilvimarinus sp. DZF01 TaxID=3461371 RepID=UPI0040460092